MHSFELITKIDMVSILESIHIPFPYAVPIKNIEQEKNMNKKTEFQSPATLEQSKIQLNTFVSV